MSDYDMPADAENAEPETKCKHTSAYCVGEGSQDEGKGTIIILQHFVCEECNTSWTEAKPYFGNKQTLK